MTDLITRLEQTQEGSRELSDEVLLACGWKKRETIAWEVDIDDYGDDKPVILWLTPDGLNSQYPPPDPTRNLQCAVDLVPEREGTNKAAFLHGVMFQLHIGDIPDKKLAISVCIALLKAKEAAE